MQLTNDPTLRLVHVRHKGFAELIAELITLAKADLRPSPITLSKQTKDFVEVLPKQSLVDVVLMLDNS